MVLSVDVPRQVMDEDSSSDWDSLTEPAPKAHQQQKPPNVELDSDEDRSHSHRSKKSSSPTVVPPQQPRKQESPVWTPRRDKGRGAPKPTPSMDVDFRPALTTSSPDPSPARKPPGKDRKGTTYDAPRNTYDPPKSSSPPSHISLTVDDSDDDAALAALRRTYEQNRPRNSRDYSAKEKEPSVTSSSQQNLKSGSGTKLSATHSKAAGDARPSQSVVSMATSDSPGPPLPSNAPRGYHGHQHQESLMVGAEEGYHGNSRRGDEGYHAGNSRHTHRSDGSARSARSVRSARSGDDLLVVESGRGRKEESPDEEGEDKRLQVYYFDEAHTEYYLSKQEGPVAVMEEYADKAELVINRGWREFFSVLRIGTLLITVFVTELIKFLIGSILRPMYVGLIVILGDRLLKPFFAATFNGVLQPFLILAYNTFIGVRMAVGPLLDVLQRMTSMAAEMLRALRLVTVQNTHYYNNGGKAESTDDCGKLTVMKETSVV